MRRLALLLLLISLLDGCAGYREPWMFWMPKDDTPRPPIQPPTGIQHVAPPSSQQMAADVARNRERFLAAGNQVSVTPRRHQLRPPKHSDAEVEQHYAQAYRMMRNTRSLVDDAKSWHTLDLRGFEQLRKLTAGLDEESKIWREISQPGDFLGSNRQAVAAREKRFRSLPPEFTTIFHAQRELVSGLGGGRECLLYLSAGAPGAIQERWLNADRNLRLCEAGVTQALRDLSGVNPQLTSQLTPVERTALFHSP
jgi:hypothetical protein